MEELDKYIEEIKEKINQIEKETQEELTEVEKIMLVYIDLGQQLYLNPNFIFGNRKMKYEIYRKDNSIQELEKIYKSKKITCRSASKIMEYIMRNLGVKISTETYDSQETIFKHTYNIIIPSDGSEPYKIDLQNDLKNIQFHTITRKFGKALNENRYVISLQQQKEIHEKIKYLTKENPYTEEYMYLLKLGASEFDNIYKKIDFVLKNIEPNPNPNIKFLERAWRHKKITDYIFGNNKIIDILNGLLCYKIDENNEKEYINCYYIIIKGVTYIYLYDTKEFRYKKYTLGEFIKKTEKEKIIIPPELKKQGLKRK